MKISLVLNGKNVEALISDDRLLIDFLRDHGCLSVKRGCESSNCGLCTVFMDDKPVLSCSVLAARADGHRIDTYNHYFHFLKAQRVFPFHKNGH